MFLPRAAAVPAAFALLAASVPLAACAQNGSANPSFDPKALALLQKAADRVQSAKTFSARLTSITVTTGAKRSESRSVGVFRGQKPNLVFQEEGPQTKSANGTWEINVSQRSVYDGKKGVMLLLENNSFVKLKDKPDARPQSYHLSFPEFFDRRFSFAQQARDMKTRGEWVSLRTVPEETFGGTACFVVEQKTLIRQYANGKKDFYTKKFYIGKNDSLLRGVHAVTTSPAGTEILDAIVSNIAVNQKIPTSVFAVNLTGYVPYGTKPRAEPERPALLTAGTVAPDFTAYDKNGKAVKLSDYKGMVVVLDFWATWCGPCMASLPHTAKVAKKTADKGVVVLAVNVWDKKAEFDKWLPKHPEFSPLTFAIDTTPGQGQDVATKQYKVSGIPTQYIIDRAGKIVTSFVGYGGPTDDLEKAIAQADKRATIAQK